MKCTVILLLLCFCLSVSAQTTDDDSNVVETDNLASIDLIKENMLAIHHQLVSKQAELAQTKDLTKKNSLESEVKRLDARLTKSKNSLVTVITDFKLENKDQAPREIKKRNILEEVQNLISPTIESIQRISAKPRRIERLKNRKAFHEEKIRDLDQALKNLEQLESNPEFKDILPEMQSAINTAKDNILDAKQEFQIKVNSLNERLHELTKDDKSVWDVTSKMVRDFLSTKGKNLLVSLIIFLVFIWAAMKFREKIVSRVLEKRPDDWYVKPVKAFYGFVAFTTAFTLSMIALYTLGDWVLVTAIFLILAAVLWSSKAYIPKYMTEFKLIMNFGTIKEGELVVYQGLPWKVKSIGFMTIFENEFLDSKQIRIQISEILKMHSRKILSKEQWFPSRSGDWILLNDMTYGKVLSQTLEQVVIEVQGAQRKYLSTHDYLNLQPTNMSHGFTTEFVWGFDYQDQKNLQSIIIPKLEDKLRQKLEAYPYPANQIIIDFHSAGESCLNLNINARFDGNYAPYRPKIYRDLQGMIFSIVTENAWNIPFKTLTIHQAKSLQ